jgi:spermidine synthase
MKHTRYLLYGCLFFSGATSLIYELLWTRIMSFSLGSTSMAFAAVLAVFFLGLAGGSLIGGRIARGLNAPFRAYGLLELGVGLSAAALFPLLFRLHHLFALVETDRAAGSEPTGIAFRFCVAALALAIPTVAMGATMPILLEHIRRQGLRFEAGLGGLYGVNTLGAFFGVYLATHWLMPRLGLERTYFAAVILNLGVFAAAWMLGAKREPHGAAETAQPGGEGAPQASGVSSASITPGMASGASVSDGRYRLIGLLLLGTTGFTTLGYEVVWGRVLSIAMEGSLYGIGATLGSFLAGIGLGGLAFARAARRLPSPQRLLRAYVAVALCILAYLALSRLVLPMEGYLLRSITQTLRNTLGIHLAFLTAILALLPITAGFGFLFPAAVAIYTHGGRSLRDPARGAGIAYALNTSCSVAGSLLSASFLMNKFGIEGVVFLNVMLMLVSLTAAVLLGVTEPGPRRAWALTVLVPFILAAGWWPEIDAKTVLINGYDGKPASLSGLFQSLSANFNPANNLKAYKDGVGSTVTVTLTGRSFGIQSNGLSQSGRKMDPPYYNMESSMVGLFPAMHKPEAGNALVVGLGAGITTGVLRKAGVPSVEVIELEPSMASICRSIYPPGQSPLDDTGVTLRLDDARNFLVRNLHRKDSRRWDIIASQPAHPWVSGAADLFTEEMFRLVYRSLASEGVFCQWFMPTSLDEAALASICNAFGRVFDRAVIYRTSNASSGFYFIGSKGDARIDLSAVERLFARPALRQLLSLNEHPLPVDVLRYAATEPVPGSVLQGPGPVNRDANAYIETRMPLLPKHRSARLNRMGGAAFTGLTPASFTAPGPGESLFVFLAIDAMSGNLRGQEKEPEADSVRQGRLELFARNSRPPYRDYYGLHMMMMRGALAPDSLDAFSRRAGDRLLKYQLRYLLIRKWPSFHGPALPETDFDSLPAGFRRDLGSEWALSNAAAGRFQEALSLAARVGADSIVLGAIRIFQARSEGKPGLPALGEREFRGLYGRFMTLWAQRAGYPEALLWYCEATGRSDRAKAIRRLLSEQETAEVQKLAQKAGALRTERNYPAALLAYDQVLGLNPAFFNAYLGKAECLGALGQAGEFAELLERARDIFPVEDVLIFRLQEAFDLAGRSVGDAGRAVR